MTLKSKLALLLLTSISYFSTNAQESALKVSHRINSDKSVDFDYEKTDPGTYTVLMKFNELSNSSVNRDLQITAKYYSGRLTSLRPDNKDLGIGFSYSTSFIRGKLKPKYDPNFLYLLPYKKNAKVKALESYYVNSVYFGNTEPEDWKAYRLFSAQQDTVTAIRKGIVVDIKDLYDTDESGGISYTSKTNDLIIEHTDGTLAVYRGFKKGSIALKVGQTVLPGTTLGINTRSNGNKLFGINIMVYYLKSADFESAKNKNLSNAKSLYGFITPHFNTAENADAILVLNQEYTSSGNVEVFKKELSKKEMIAELK